MLQLLMLQPLLVLPALLQVWLQFFYRRLIYP